MDMPEFYGESYAGGSQTAEFMMVFSLEISRNTVYNTIID